MPARWGPQDGETEATWRCSSHSHDRRPGSLDKREQVGVRRIWVVYTTAGITRERQQLCGASLPEFFRTRSGFDPASDFCGHPHSVGIKPLKDSQGINPVVGSHTCPDNIGMLIFIIKARYRMWPALRAISSCPIPPVPQWRK